MESSKSTFNQMNKALGSDRLQLNYNTTEESTREKKKGVAQLLTNISNKLCLSYLIYQK